MEDAMSDIGVVKVRSWSSGMFIKEPQALKHAVISPSLDSLLLLSHAHPHALLLPLTPSIADQQPPVTTTATATATAIADVRCCAWGCFADRIPSTHSQARTTGLFTQVLFVSTSTAFSSPHIVIHCFLAKQNKEAMPAGDGIVNWGPKDSHEQDDDIMYGACYSKQWMHSFLASLHFEDHGDKLSVSFLHPSSISSSANVVSFLVNYDSIEFRRFVNKTKRSSPFDKFSGCSKLFSSPSGTLVGMVLEGFPAVDQQKVECCVVVSVLYEWGISWICSVDISENSSWLDFQLSNDLLFGLDENGMVYIWSAMDGKLTGCIDITQRVGFRCEKGEFKDTAKPPSGFTKLAVTADSSLIAATHKNGSVHVISRAECFSTNKDPSKKLDAGSDLQSISPWDVASCNVGIQKPLSDITNTHLGRFSKHTREKLPSYINKKVSSMKERLNAYQPTSIKPLRGIFLPCHKHEANPVISISPYGITKFLNSTEHKIFKVVQTPLRLSSLFQSSGCLDSNQTLKQQLHTFSIDIASKEGAFGFCHQSCLYFVSRSGLHVVLPPISISSNSMQNKFKPELAAVIMNAEEFGNPSATSFLFAKQKTQVQPQWKTEVIDRAIIFDGPNIAEDLCTNNGWNLKETRLRWLQLALDYLQFDAVERALEALIPLNAAEDGMMQVLFASLELTLQKSSTDNDLMQALKLIATAICFATKMVSSYGKMNLRSRKKLFNVWNDATHNQTKETKAYDLGVFSKLQDMSCFLEVSRKLQDRFNGKLMPKQAMRDEEDELARAPVAQQMDTDMQIETDTDADKKKMPVKQISVSGGSATEDATNQILPVSNEAEHLVLSPLDLVATMSGDIDPGVFRELSVSTTSEQGGRRFVPLENPEDMVKRWEVEQLDLTSVVKDALRSGRLPLAVLQFHRLKSKDSNKQREFRDVFREVQEVGKTIVYELFCKGKPSLAVSALQRLGENLESNLKELAFGTVNRFLRAETAQELKNFNYLRSSEMVMMERISLLERLYPSSSFWRTFSTRQTVLYENDQSKHIPGESKLTLICSTGPFRDVAVECGEIDGVIAGSWSSISNNVCSHVGDKQDNPAAGYWAGAAIWLEAWEQSIMDRIILDQPLFMGVHIPWEAQFEYYLEHTDWIELSKILDSIPPSLLHEGMLHIQLDDPDHLTKKGFVQSYVQQEVDSVEITVPSVKILNIPIRKGCGISVRRLAERKLLRKLIFLNTCWKGTKGLLSLMAEECLISENFKNTSELHNTTVLSDTDLSYVQQGDAHSEVKQAINTVVLRHCVEYELPHLLDVYLDNTALAHDTSSLSPKCATVGGYFWAKLLLLLATKGYEYEASFYNARLNLTRNMCPDKKYDIVDAEVLIPTIDDIAEMGGELAALATLMYAPVPVQQCLHTGSVNVRCQTSFQCTVESLQPYLQSFPTIWHSFLAVCFGKDPCIIPVFHANLSIRNHEIIEYLNWRECIFSSAWSDASLLQMMPCWFPKRVRRLLQLYVQGPVAGPTTGVNMENEELLTGEGRSLTYEVDTGKGIGVVTWELALQKDIEQELYASSFQEGEYGVEHHLHRGRPIAAFSSLIEKRAQKIMSLGHSQNEQTPMASRGQLNDLQMLLAPLTLTEEKLLSSVMPLAIRHFDNDVLVASCVSLLELCGISATGVLLVDIAALRQIALYYKNHPANKYSGKQKSEEYLHISSSSEVDITASLAQNLADEYASSGIGSLVGRSTNSSFKPTDNLSCSKAVISLLHHLEKACLSEVVNVQSPGSWLLTGEGDGSQLRSRQRSNSESWCLVTNFCHAHHLPVSTTYLGMLARDNDWVGFLAEAQFEGCSIESVISVASKEFTDVRLRCHILTVLKTILSSKQKNTSEGILLQSVTDNLANPSFSPYVIPSELFGLLAECEKQKHPGRELLIKAKELRWPLLAVIASCFQDISSFSCLTVWLEITAARETSSIRVDDIGTRIAAGVAAAIEATNALHNNHRNLSFRYNRKNPKRRRLIEQNSKFDNTSFDDQSQSEAFKSFGNSLDSSESKMKQCFKNQIIGQINNEQDLLCNMIGVLCEQHLFLPLLKAFDLFLPTCSLLPFIRFLQAFSQMRLSEASAHIASFSSRVKDEIQQGQTSSTKSQKQGFWITSAAVKAANAILATCPSAYERQCLLKLLSSADYGDVGTAAAHFRQLYWKSQLVEPTLRQGAELVLETTDLDDGALLKELVKRGYWEEAHSWARQLEATSPEWKSAVHHVTERQAEAMVLEWKEFLWDVPEEQPALWNHCQDLFVKYSFPPLQAGMFFLRHANAIENDVPPSELHGILLLALQWLSGNMTKSQAVYPLHLLREIETRVWLLAVESEAEAKNQRSTHYHSMKYETSLKLVQESSKGFQCSAIDHTANVISTMDSHLSTLKTESLELSDKREAGKMDGYNVSTVDTESSTGTGSSSKQKRRNKAHIYNKRSMLDIAERNQSDMEENVAYMAFSKGIEDKETLRTSDKDFKIEVPLVGWEERVGAAQLERSVLALLEVGQISAAKQLQHKLSPASAPLELLLIEDALKIAESAQDAKVGMDLALISFRSPTLQSLDVKEAANTLSALQVLEIISAECREGCGRGLCNRIIAVAKIASFLSLSFNEAFQKQPIELLQFLSLNAQDSLEEAKILVQTHPMPAESIAKVLAESFLKGLLAAHRGGYLDSSQREEGPAPLLWRTTDFLKWAELCPSQSELGHALMRLVIAGHDIPHACEVELLILAHRFYKSSACLDGVDVLVGLAVTRVDSYVAEKDFSCLAHLVIGISNFHAFHFILDILIENGQLDLLLQDYSITEAAEDSAGTIRGFRMSVLSALKHFNSNDLDAFAMVYNHFDMKHEKAALLESRAQRCLDIWLLQHDREHSEELLEMMRYYVEAAEVYSSIDAGNKTRWACAQASVVSLQIRMPDTMWLKLSETNARRILIEQSRFQEALIVAEAYNLNQSGEWVPVIWNQMMWPELVEKFLSEFVSVLPLPASMLMELARFYRSEVTARGEPSHFGKWLSAGLPHEWARNLGKSFRSLLRRTRDVRLRIQLATTATGFPDVIDSCMQILDKVPETAGPLILRKGHGGAYLPLM